MKNDQWKKFFSSPDSSSFIQSLSSPKSPTSRVRGPIFIYLGLIYIYVWEEECSLSFVVFSHTKITYYFHHSALTFHLPYLGSYSHEYIERLLILFHNSLVYYYIYYHLFDQFLIMDIWVISDLLQLSTAVADFTHAPSCMCTTILLG